MPQLPVVPHSVDASPTPRTIAVAGAGAALGQRVTALIAADPSVLPRSIAPDDPDPAGSLVGSDVLVVLDPASDGDLGGTDGSPTYLARVRSLLRAATAAGVESLVVMSSALTYGAWSNNPVPLTEDAPLRPVPTCLTAVERAEVERLVEEWRAAQPDRRVAMLRPVVTVDAARSAWFASSVWAPTSVRPSEGEPPRQFLDLDDLASAVVLAARDGLSGPFNVAPDGWLSADELRALAGWTGPRRVDRGVSPYLHHPWVVANDRLKDAGWKPVSSSEEAFVEVDRAGPLRSLSPRVRQELSLAAVGVLALTALGAGVVLLRRRSRRRS